MLELPLSRASRPLVVAEGKGGGPAYALALLSDVPGFRAYSSNESTYRQRSPKRSRIKVGLSMERVEFIETQLIKYPTAESGDIQPALPRCCE